jgi:hypothetical protein
MEEPHPSMYKANESMNKHNPKKKQKQTINTKEGKNPMQIRPMTMK